MRNSLFVAAAVAALSLGLTAPATAAPDGDGGTFVVTAAGGLSISAQTAPVSVGVLAPPGSPVTVTAALGPVTVTDTRGLSVASWTASVSATPLTSGGQASIPRGAVIYTPNVAVTTGVAVFKPGQRGPMVTTRTAYSAEIAAGNNSATWNPTISVRVPGQAPVGTYAAVITHSVA